MADPGRLALGTVQFGQAYGVANRSGLVPATEVSRILSLARRVGMDTLDTASAYGASERVLGEAGMDSWRVVTKVPGVPDGVDDVAAWVHRQVGSSLELLQTRQVYGLLLHRAGDLRGPHGERLAGALRRERQTGRARKIGVSVYDPAELEFVMELLGPDLVQAPLNVLDRRLVTSGWLARLARENVEVHVRSVFLQGLLLMPADERPARFARWKPVFDHWESWRSEAGLSGPAGCLSYVLSHGAVDRVVVGVDSVGQLRDLLAATSETASMPDVPDDIACSDVDLINPARWSAV